MEKNYSVKQIVLDLVSIQSDTGTALEVNVANKISSYISSDPYFQEHPEYWGTETRGDIFNRPVIWALKKGTTNKTIILSGHYDAVEIDCYGELKPYALSPEILKQKISELSLTNEKLKSDLKDPNWMFGRGVADMKSGVAMALYTLLTCENPQVNILFTAVSDEENISAGTLISLPIYLELKRKFNLDYKLTIISEPQFNKPNEFIVYNGGTGKLLPMIVTKGKVSHCAEPLKGLNAVHMLAEIVRNIDLNPELTTADLGVSSQVPIVQIMKDLKNTYDVSIPDFAVACVNVLFLNGKNPPIIMKKIEDICKTSMDTILKKYEESFKFTLEKNLIGEDDKLDLQIEVITLSELESKVAQIRSDYGEFKSNLEDKLHKKIMSQEYTLQTASIAYMQEMIKASCITNPLVVVGIAPPYYPAVCNEYMDKDMSVFKNSISKITYDKYKLPLNLTPYFTGMGDISYMTCVDPKTERELMSNLSLPSSLYDIPFEASAELDTPCLYLGPRSEDIHQWSERVYLPDIEKIVPEIIMQLINDL